MEIVDQVVVLAMGTATASRYKTLSLYFTRKGFVF